MPIFSHTDLRELSVCIFKNAGVASDEAEIISDHLVDANLCGHDSHGVLRISSYVTEIQAGHALHSEASAGRCQIVKETPCTAVIDARGGFGIVAALRAMQMAIEKAREHTFGSVGVHRCTHTGRLGDYPPRAAREGMIGIVLLNGGGRFVAPFGGSERRLPPNPISVSVPKADGEPIMLDITTSVVAGGKIELKAARGEKMPEGWMKKSDGSPTTDPRDFGEDPSTFVPPLGGPAGHKGFGLGMIVDLLAGGLSWAGCSQPDPTRGACGFLAMAIKIESFIDLEEYERETQILTDWVKSSKTLPGVERIYVPGEIEQETRKARLKAGIYIEESTWNKIRSTAEDLNVPVPRQVESGQ